VATAVAGVAGLVGVSVTVATGRAGWGVG